MLQLADLRHSSVISSCAAGLSNGSRLQGSALKGSERQTAPLLGTSQIKATAKGTDQHGPTCSEYGKPFGKCSPFACGAYIGSMPSLTRFTQSGRELSRSHELSKAGSSFLLADGGFKPKLPEFLVCLQSLVRRIDHLEVWIRLSLRFKMRVYVGSCVPHHWDHSLHQTHPPLSREPAILGPMMLISLASDSFWTPPPLAPAARAPPPTLVPLQLFRAMQLDAAGTPRAACLRSQT